jgi:hypothetical protein
VERHADGSRRRGPHWPLERLPCPLKVTRLAPSTLIRSCFKPTRRPCALPRPGVYCGFNQYSFLHHGGLSRVSFGYHRKSLESSDVCALRVSFASLNVPATLDSFHGSAVFLPLVYRGATRIRGVATVYAVKTAGLAIGIGIGEH